jgi:hypothetical protein
LYGVFRSSAYGGLVVTAEVSESGLLIVDFDVQASWELEDLATGRMECEAPIRLIPAHSRQGIAAAIVALPQQARPRGKDNQTRFLARVHRGLWNINSTISGCHCREVALTSRLTDACQARPVTRPLQAVSRAAAAGKAYRPKRGAG